jgi:hypothetical protein
MLKYVARAWPIACIVSTILASPKPSSSAPSDFAPYCSKAYYDHSDDAKAQEQQENLCLRILAKSAARQDDVLTLRLADGSSKTYRTNRKACDDDNGSECISYWLVGYHPTARLFILLTGDYDGFSAMFVSALDGTDET